MHRKTISNITYYFSYAYWSYRLCMATSLYIFLKGLSFLEQKHILEWRTDKSHEQRVGTEDKHTLQCANKDRSRLKKWLHQLLSPWKSLLVFFAVNEGRTPIGPNLYQVPHWQTVPAWRRAKHGSWRNQTPVRKGWDSLEKLALGCHIFPGDIQEEQVGKTLSPAPVAEF